VQANVSAIPEAFRRHAAAKYVSEADVQAALEAGRFTSGAFGRPVPVRELLRTYQIRKAHLATIDTAHARRLEDDVATLCAALERLPLDASATATYVTFDDGRSITIWETPGHELLAVVSAFDDGLISEATRRDLWGKDRA
jgi:hypothetical protein